MEISPIVFTLGPLQVRWYGIALVGSFLFGIWYLVTRGKSKGLNPDHLVAMSLWVLIAGILGARLVYVAANNPSWFWEEPWRILEIYKGGLAWHGGLLGGVSVAFFYLRRAKISFHRVADLCVPGILLGYSLIRLANIVNGENLGRMTDFSFGRWPAQLIAAGIGLALLVRHFWLSKKRLPDGYLFWSFLFYHQIFRAGIEETIREMHLVVNLYTNAQWGIGLLTMVQVTTPPILAFVGWILFSRLKRSEKVAA